MKNVILHGKAEDKLKEIKGKSVNCVVTSPPYWGLRSYGDYPEQLGLEETPEKYVNNIVNIFREVWRVLRDDGTVWIVIGDSYNGSGKGAWDKTNVQKEVYVPSKETKATKVNNLKPKDLVGIPWQVAFALQKDGWYLRDDIIWHKRNPMPSSVKDRTTKAHEYIFLLSKSKKYYYDNEAIQEEATGYDGRKDTKMKGSNKYKEANIMPGQQQQSMAKRGHERWKFKEGIPIRNKRSVWTVNTKGFKGHHFGVFPKELIQPCILAGCPKNGIVLDPFIGVGTTALVSKKFERNYIGIELNKDYIDIINDRL